MRIPCKWTAGLMAVLLMCGLGLAGVAETADAKPYAGTTLTFMMIPATNNAETRALIELVREKTGIEITIQVVAETVDTEIDQGLVRLMAGDEADIVYYASPRLKPLYNAGVLTPLDELAAALGYDMQAVYGDYLPVFGHQVWGLPAFSDIWLTLYNKQVFDNAGLPYPSAEGWTWTRYVETARALTDFSRGVYGSLMLDYNSYNYMLAQQMGVSHYAEDGLSNYADPAFAEALSFFYGLGNTEKIQPSISEFVAGNIPWDAFFTQHAEFGMFVCGGWTLQMMAETENYPRDWQFGILPMPYPEGESPSTLTLPGCYAIPATSKQKEAAFTAIACMAENQYTLGYGRIPARKDLSDADINAYIEQELIEPYQADGVTVEDIRAAWFDQARIAYPEKVIGPADVALNEIWVEEGQRYGQGFATLENAMKSIREKADAAITQSGERGTE